MDSANRPLQLAGPTEAQGPGKTLQIMRGKKGLLRMAIISGLAKGKIKPGSIIQVTTWKSIAKRQTPEAEK